MALTLLLRNATKFNVAGLANCARLTPLKSLTTKAGVGAAVVANAVKPVALLKNVQPLVRRNISLSAPRLAHSSNHTPMWTAERLVSLGLLFIIPTAFFVSSKALDAAMATAIVLHTHWGVEAMITDYCRPSIVGPVLPKVAHGLALLLSVATLAGLFYVVYNDVGLAEHIKNLWSIKGYENEDGKEKAIEGVGEGESKSEGKGESKTGNKG